MQAESTVEGQTSSCWRGMAVWRVVYRLSCVHFQLRSVQWRLVHKSCSPPKIILKDCIFVFILIGLLFHLKNSVIKENGKKILKPKRKTEINQELRERQTRAAESFVPPEDPKLMQ
ncbi:hypothetical protein AVEN_19627-1 [Araneus ventricosus]|uniref:Uncharacterized protein n=1 Tax=Araneus ventricosus TaxID=182803 RepID=A0A4Y2KKC6_ARAVE|nr:hypothetical protein AVEN_19627-1 [Araneus ventricosus]